MAEQQIFQASAEAKSKATRFRIFAFILWLLAMGGQAYAILNLLSDEKIVWLIAAIALILIFAMSGSYLWKKANRLDPASEKDTTRFFIQNQLGAIMGVLAFLPMVIFIFSNKNLSGKTKGIAGSIAVIAMAAAGITGADFDPPSVEKYTEEINAQTEELKQINGNSDLVYWSRAGNKYHVYDDCYHIKNKDLNSGTVKDSWEEKGISELCKTCKKRVISEKSGGE